jgi:hypothetical protein
MLKKLMAGLVISSFFLSFSQISFAQTMTMDGNSDNGNSGGGLFNRIMNHPINIGGAVHRVMTAPITKTTLMEGAEDVVVYKNAKGLGLVDLALTGVATLTIQEIMYHPDNIENFLEGYPGMISTIVKKVSPYPWGTGYLDNIGVGDRFYTQQEDLEQTAEWQKAYFDVQTQIVAVAEQQPEEQDCKNPNVAQQAFRSLLESPDIFVTSTTGQAASKYFFNQTQNTMPQGGVAPFDVNSYKLLTKYSAEDDYMQNDHIPAKATLKRFLEQRLGMMLTNAQYLNAQNNSVAMTVPDAMHKFGRTYKGKNSSTVQIADSQALQMAVIKDLANHWLYVTQNGLNLVSFTTGAIILYNRDRAMCLFN